MESCETELAPVTLLMAARCLTIVAGHIFQHLSTSSGQRLMVAKSNFGKGLLSVQCSPLCPPWLRHHTRDLEESVKVEGCNTHEYVLFLNNKNKHTETKNLLLSICCMASLN